MLSFVSWCHFLRELIVIFYYVMHLTSATSSSDEAFQSHHRSKRSVELDYKNIQLSSYSNYISIESDFYTRNANKLNDILMFVSDEITISNGTLAETDENLLHQSTVLSVSSYLSQNFLCHLNQNALLRTECTADTMAFKNNPRFNRPMRVVARKVSATMQFNQIMKLYNQIEDSYFNDRFKSGEARKVLHAVLVIAKTNLISMFKLMFKNLNVSVIALDVHSFFYRPLLKNNSSSYESSVRAHLIKKKHKTKIRIFITKIDLRFSQDISYSEIYSNQP